MNTDCTAMRRFLLAACAALLLPASTALAADPIPGAHYEGTTENGSPFSFDAGPDGTTVTNVTTTLPATCLGGYPGVEITAVANTFAFPVAGGAISGKDEKSTPNVELKGTFTSPSEANGTITTFSSSFSALYGLTTCRGERNWTAKTSAAAPKTPATPATPAPEPTTVVPLTIKVAIPSGVKLLPSLRNGFVVGGGANGPAKLVGTIALRAADAKRYGVRGAVARARSTVAADGRWSLNFKPSRKAAAKLKRARRVAFRLTLVATDAAGKATTTKRTLTLVR